MYILYIYIYVSTYLSVQNIYIYTKNEYNINMRNNTSDCLYTPYDCRELT